MPSVHTFEIPRGMQYALPRRGCKLQLETAAGHRRHGRRCASPGPPPTRWLRGPWSHLLPAGPPPASAVPPRQDSPLPPPTPYSSAGPSGAGTGTASAQRRGATSSASTSASSGRASLAAARTSLPDPPVLYPFQEVAAATNSVLAKRAGGAAASTAHWSCSLRGRDAALFQLQRRPGAAAVWTPPC